MFVVSRSICSICLHFSWIRWESGSWLPLDRRREEVRMKEIKAYIRRDRVNRTVDGLQKAGAQGITIVEVHPIGYGH